MAEEKLFINVLVETIIGCKLFSFPGQPVPERLMGVARFLATFQKVLDQLTSGEFRFIEDHLITSLLRSWDRLGTQMASN